jgi:molecular chaperone GrpE
MAQNKKKSPPKAKEKLEVVAENEEATVEAEESEDDADPLDALEAERDEWKDKAYRLAAEMENIKKRHEKEMADTRKYAISNIAKELVEVRDNLDRALETMQNDQISGDDALKAMLEGIKMIETQLETSCKKLNISKIESLGKQFDPELHQVMMEVEDEKAKSGTIVQEMQAGYTIGERLLRPAMVSTAK